MTHELGPNMANCMDMKNESGIGMCIMKPKCDQTVSSRIESVLKYVGHMRPTIAKARWKLKPAMWSHWSYIVASFWQPNWTSLSQTSWRPAECAPVLFSSNRTSLIYCLCCFKQPFYQQIKHFLNAFRCFVSWARTICPNSKRCWIRWQPLHILLQYENSVFGPLGMTSKLQKLHGYLFMRIPQDALSCKFLWPHSYLKPLAEIFSVWFTSMSPNKTWLLGLDISHVGPKCGRF